MAPAKARKADPDDDARRAAYERVWTRDDDPPYGFDELRDPVRLADVETLARLHGLDAIDVLMCERMGNGLEDFARHKVRMRLQRPYPPGVIDARALDAELERQVEALYQEERRRPTVPPVLDCGESGWDVLTVLHKKSCAMSAEDIAAEARPLSKKRALEVVLPELVRLGLVEDLEPRFKITEKGRGALEAWRAGRAETEPKPN